MNQCDRIKLILQENKLKQKQFACVIGVSVGVEELIFGVCG